LGKKLKPFYRKPNPIRNYVHDTQADTTKAENMLGFKAKISLKAGIKQLLEKLEKNRENDII
jgi:UDP-glucose 4-epimerase